MVGDLTELIQVLKTHLGTKQPTQEGSRCCRHHLMKGSSYGWQSCSHQQLQPLFKPKWQSCLLAVSNLSL